MASSSFTVQSSQNHFEVQDSVNNMTWGPFPTEDEARHQVVRLEHLAELQEILRKLTRLEESLWEESTLDTEASRQAKDLESAIRNMVDDHLARLKAGQASQNQSR